MKKIEKHFTSAINPWISFLWSTYSFPFPIISRESSIHHSFSSIYLSSRTFETFLPLPCLFSLYPTYFSCMWSQEKDEEIKFLTWLLDDLFTIAILGWIDLTRSLDRAFADRLSTWSRLLTRISDYGTICRSIYLSLEFSWRLLMLSFIRMNIVIHGSLRKALERSKISYHWGKWSENLLMTALNPRNCPVEAALRRRIMRR